MANPQTRTSSQQANRLIDETSPYLQQHADNPVEWYPWGDEALQKAREENKPIFLSIGYSACHWCHVMAHESFEAPNIADLMNRYFVNIKVDREERPDLDQIYMNAVMALTGHGGWPMSVFLTPDLKPFYGGTYWPPTPRMGMPGFADILQKVHEAWETRHEEVLRAGNELTEAVGRLGLPQGGTTELSEDLLRNAMQSLLRAADRIHGGFGSAPKFPHPMDLRLLLRCSKRFGNQDARDVARLTLDQMARGGIYDHLGGGFHRYATDPRWLVPHFEKMLYDNALLSSAYLEAWQATGESDHRRVVRETLDYVLREMTSPEGGFYSTQDADSEGVEGKYYVWTKEEIERVLDEDEARLFNACYDVTSEGNWEGKTILNRPQPHAEQAQKLNRDEEDLAAVLDHCKKTLLEIREQRVPPGRDEKIIVAWNGLMIAAMAQAGQVLEEPRYTESARKAADFLLEHLRTDEGRLLHSFKDGRAQFNAYLDDYACLIDALVDVYQATFEPQYVQAAVDLAERMIAHFHDGDGGGFFYTSDDHEALITRSKDSQDTATPSGNATAATGLLRLGRLCGRADFEEKAYGTLRLLSGQLARVPTSGGQALIALDFHLGKTYEIALVDGERPDENEEALRVLNGRFLPNKVLARRSQETTDDALPKTLRPLLGGKTAQNGSVTIYLCEHGTCHAPVAGVDGLKDALAEDA